MKINSITIDSTNSRTDLCELGNKYPTDKSPYAFASDPGCHKHPYTAVYDFLFSPFRNYNILMAEIGVLDNNSMKCWREYFSNAILVGFDFNKDLLEKAKEDGLRSTEYHFMDVTNSESIDTGLSNWGGFEIIIDDSTHQPEDQLRIINTAYKYLKPGGILVVEDIFRNIPNEKFENGIKEANDYFSSATFVVTEHELRYSPNWDNDKLLFLIRNDRRV